MIDWIKVSDRLPDDHAEVLTKNNGANTKAVFIYDDHKKPTFIHFSRNGKMRTLNNVTEWCQYFNGVGK